MKKISIVVSVYNEEEVLPKFYNTFEEFKKNISWDYELVFVNDGSVDNSINLLRGFAKKTIRLKLLIFQEILAMRRP